MEWNRSTKLRWTNKVHLEFGEDAPASFHYAVAMKKRLRLLSEERLSPREEKTYGDLRHFFAKKMAAGFFIFPRHSETIFEAKTSEFRCEMIF